MSIKFLVLGGGVFWVWGGGGSADFIFMGAGISLISGKFRQGVSKQGGNVICMVTAMTAR